MARLSRSSVLQEGCSFHKVWRAHNKEWLLNEPATKQAYIEAIATDYETKCKDGSFQIHAYNIMSNHVHEICTLASETEEYSDHMRRAHSVFAQRFNRRNNRSGSVVEGRPKTLGIKDARAAILCQFYVDANPVRAGIVSHPLQKHPGVVSSVRLYAEGSSAPADRIITFPDWYLNLAKTKRGRRKKYRSLLDRYLVNASLIRDPTMTSGSSIDSTQWSQMMVGDRDSESTPVKSDEVSARPP